MSIFFICGKPGGGKSYMGVSQICEELKDINAIRTIVTNIPLNLAELANWCHENVKFEVNIKERVRILDEAQTGEFWKFEPNRVWDKRKKFYTGEGKNRREYDVPDFDGRGNPGTLYVIDEIHIHFGAREWQQTGTDCTWFLTQHRKLGCDVIMITQHPDQTDKALRRLAQEFMTVRNLSREPVLGFRAGNFFRYIRSLSAPNTPNWAPFETGFVRLKPEELGKLYDTTAGVGIAGRVTPRREKRGRSVWWLAVPVVAFVLFLWNLKPIVSWARGKASVAVSSGLGAVMTNAGPTFTGREIPNKAKNEIRSYPVASKAEPKTAPRYDVVTPTATNRPTYVEKIYFHKTTGLQWFVLLSDGNTYESGLDSLTVVTPFSVVLNGKRYPTKNWALPIDNRFPFWHTNSVMNEETNNVGGDSGTKIVLPAQSVGVSSPQP